MSNVEDFVENNTVEEIIEQEGVDFHIPPEPEPIDPTLGKINEKDRFIMNLQNILNNADPEDNGSKIINLAQKNRALLLDIAMQTFISKPNNPKLLDSINTIIMQLEKSVRDDRKELAKKEEVEDNKANFNLFLNALTEISAGKLQLPTFKAAPVGFDPLAELEVPTDDLEIIEDELVMGNVLVDSKEIEQDLDA